MDPNAAHSVIRAQITRLRDQEGDELGYSNLDTGWLIDAVEALDEWLSKGGFLPEAWQTLKRK